MTVRHIGSARVDPATVLRCVMTLRNMPPLSAPPGEYKLIEYAAAAMLKLTPDMETVEDGWIMVPRTPNSAMMLAGFEMVSDIAEMTRRRGRLNLVIPADIGSKVWQQMLDQAPEYLGVI